MPYLRVKWIKGHPYLYEQASYREGGKVRTKHIRYVGKYGSSGFGRGGSSGVGLTPPKGVSAERKAYVDTEINHLKLGDTFPFERELLRQYMYHQDYRLNFNSRSLIAEGYVKQPAHDYADLYDVDGFGLRSDSGAHTWLHEMGHSLELVDKLVDGEIEKLRRDFINHVHEEVRAARRLSVVSSIPKLESFIQKYGRFFDIRTMDSPETEAGQQGIAEMLSLVKSAVETNSHFRKILYVPLFSLSFFGWTTTAYRLDPSEIFADTVASLILDPKKAFDAHGPEGRKYVTRVWVKLVKHFEDTYQLSLKRPKKSKQKIANETKAGGEDVAQLPAGDMTDVLLNKITGVKQSTDDFADYLQSDRQTVRTIVNDFIDYATVSIKSDAEVSSIVEIFIGKGDDAIVSYKQSIGEYKGLTDSESLQTVAMMNSALSEFTALLDKLKSAKTRTDKVIALDGLISAEHSRGGKFLTHGYGIGDIDRGDAFLGDIMDWLRNQNEYTPESLSKAAASN